jgi:hypothetical protein
MLRALQQRLRGNAAYVSASASRSWPTFGIFPLINTSRIETQLRGTNGSNVATWATADDDDVKLFAHPNAP